ncbi:TspO/MBR family protein [Haloferula sargassicola]|uniref:Tryptophan-rich protein TspO n=1 Tax=Haloferula sargassicola TaxID=490096 RepID=A0ABP9UN13_9BACT
MLGLKAKIILSIIVCELLGAWSGFSTVRTIEGWYDRLIHPPGTPPDWVFGPVWIALYAAMGAAFGLVWERAPAGMKKWQAMAMFVVQLLLNLVWSPVFFGMRRTEIGLVIVAALFMAVFITVLAFHPLEKKAAWLLLPYLAWTGYAAYLNAGILVLNG